MMQAVTFNRCATSQVPAPLHLDDHAVQIINHLRLVSLQCRSAAWIDLDQACALLLSHPADAKMRHAETLMRGFRQAVDRRPVFYRPGTTELSFDEAWLGRLFTSLQAGDDDSFRFLIQSRVPRWTRRNLAFLVKSISEQFCKD